MHFSRFRLHLEKETVAPVYLFTGEAEFFMEEAWRELVARIVPPKARNFNGERLQAWEHSALELLNRLNTLILFGKRRLVLVEQVDAWPRDQRKVIMEYLKKPSPFSCLVMTRKQKKGWEDLVAAVEKVGLVVQFPLPSERDLAGWLQERAKAAGKILAQDAASHMLDQVGIDLYPLVRELEKLLAYVGEKEKITLDDARQVVSRQKTFTVFELLDHVSGNRPRHSLDSLRALLLAGENPLGVLALLARQIRLLWQVKDALERGLPFAQLAAHVKLPASVLRKYAEQTSRFTQEDLHRIHRAIAQADLTMKSSASSPEWVLEALVFSLAGGGE